MFKELESIIIIPNYPFRSKLDPIFRIFYRPATLWPPSSPDLNPLDFACWGVIERRACAIPHRNIDELKVSVEREWSAMSDEFVQSSCAAFRPRIESVIKAKGGHIEN